MTTTTNTGSPPKISHLRALPRFQTPLTKGHHLLLHHLRYALLEIRFFESIDQLERVFLWDPLHFGIRSEDGQAPLPLLDRTEIHGRHRRPPFIRDQPDVRVVLLGDGYRCALGRVFQL
jgi:hypothetical protein